MKKKADNLGVKEVREYLRKQLDDLKARGIKETEINTETIVKKLNIIQAISTVCSAMRSCGYEYEEIYSPPKGNNF
ncbi:hypothetical protein [Fusobacterium sp.]|uniref:hypothetical protein n=1 Tax=Fusobacterium sp. TaxID=68766 RepID=UPI0025B8B6B4|nr:hypothetical protein [Fusobacterium sp.]